MDYLEYKDFLAHGKIYVSHDGGPKEALKNQSTFGSRIKKRLAGAKAAGTKMFGGKSVGGKSGRKWKSHKYIAIVNGRYIYPAKKAFKQTFTKSGRQAKRLALARSEGTARERAAVSKKQYYKELNNETEAKRQKLNVGQRKNKQSREYGAAVQREIETRARREAHAKTYYQNAEAVDKYSARLRRMDRAEASINRLRSALGKEANASSKVAAPAKKIVRSKKEQHELNQQAIESANKSNKKVNSKPQQQSPTSKPKKQSELSKSLKEIKDYASKKIKNGEVTFGPDPEAIKKAVQESKKKKKKR